MKKQFISACVYACRCKIVRISQHKNIHTVITIRLVLLLCFSLVTGPMFAQDSLFVTVRQADSLFLTNNLRLLAERYQIDIARSAEIQDKLWDNPSLTMELSAFNPSSGFLDVGKRGQKFVSIEQLIILAGKRKKQVALDMEATRKTEFEFFELVRTMKFDLRQIFFETYFLNQTLQLIDSQIGTLNVTILAFEKELARNNIALKEVVRLKALLFQLTTDRAEILFNFSEYQRDLKTYLNVELPVKPLVDSVDISRYNITAYNSSLLKDRALLSRMDLKAANSLTKQAELNYALQKSLAVPNLQIGANYDQASNYVFHYFGISATVDIPFFNRNQGNIRGAKSSIGYYKTQEMAFQISISNQVDAAIEKISVADQAFKSVEGQFTDQFRLLSQGIFENFRKRNISLLEFIDFIETYNESVKQFNKLRSERIKVYEELNFVVGEELFN